MAEVITIYSDIAKSVSKFRNPEMASNQLL